MNKKKIINDPVHGFINIPSELIFDIVQHSVFQRLRRIRQLGLAEFIYPGATHTRFIHALGAMHLMTLALDTLRNKGVEISEKEYESTLIAILLHDLGHGPMSHALEHTILKGVPHEHLSYLLMQKINEDFNYELNVAIEIFLDKYPRRFLHQLVSSQLDMDRLDYLQRDRFFTGVLEGTVASDRIIKMLTVREDELLIEEKGIYSIENFLTARRLMYWQVYLHKTNLSIEQMLIQSLKRARHLVGKGKSVFALDSLAIFLENKVKKEDFTKESNYLKDFVLIDDYDVWACLKAWQNSKDKILSLISGNLLNRRLFKVSLSREKFSTEYHENLKGNITKNLSIGEKEAKYFIIKNTSTNEAYLSRKQKIKILTKKGEVLDIAQASDLPNIKALRKIVKKYYICYYK